MPLSPSEVLSRRQALTPQEELAGAQQSVYGAPKGPSTFDVPDQLGQLLAKAQNTHKAKDLGKLKAQIKKIAPDLDAATLKKYGIQQPKKKGGALASIGRAVGGIPGATTVLSVLDRPAQAVQQLARGAEENWGTKETLGNLWNSLQGDYSVGGKKQDERANLTQLIHQDRNYKPHGKGDALLNFVGDVALDPTTYLTFGASGAAKSGLSKLSAAAGEGAVEESLLKGLVSGAVKKLPEGVAETAGLTAKEVRALGKSARGGVRFAGVPVPGTTRLTKEALGPSTTLAERLGVSVPSAISEPVQGAREALGGAFVPRSAIERESGRLTADRFGQLQTVSHGITDDIATHVDRGILEGTKEAAGAAGVDAAMAGSGKTAELVDYLQTEASKAGLFPEKTIAEKVAEHVDKGLTQAQAVRKVAEEVAPQAGLAHLADDLINFTDDFGKPYAYAADAISAEEAAARGLEPLQLANRTVYVPAAAHAAVKGFSANLTNDAALALVQNTLHASQQAWKRAATVLPVGPGFIARNGTGNIFTMVGAGFSHPKSFYDAWKVSHALTNGTEEALTGGARALWEEGTKQGIIQSGHSFRELDNIAAQARKAAEKGQAVEGLAGNVKKGLKTVVSAPSKKGSQWNQSLETASRLAMFQDGLKKGMTATDAAIRTKATLFDYADLTVFERNKLKEIMPFYTYARKNVALQKRLLMSTPGVVTGQVHAMNAITELFGNPDLGALPDWAVSGGQMAVGNNLVGLASPLVGAAESVAPATELANVLPGGAPVNLGNLAHGVIDPAGGVLPGLAKAGAESITGENLFTGQKTGNTYLDNPLINNLVPTLGRGKQTQGALSELLSSPTDVKTLLSTLGFTAGLKVRHVDDTMHSMAQGDQLDALKEILAGEPNAPSISALRTLGLVAPAEKKPKKGAKKLTRTEEVKKALAARKKALTPAGRAAAAEKERKKALLLQVLMEGDTR